MHIQELLRNHKTGDAIGDAPDRRCRSQSGFPV